MSLPPFRHQAACSPETAHLFAAEAGGLASRAREREAKAICEGCPVRDACLDWALEHGEAGIWGGTTTRERPKVRRIRRSHRELPPTPRGAA